VDANGIVYVADSNNSTIRRIGPAGDVTTLAGSPGAIGTADGTGSAARFWNPRDLAIGPDGLIYVADTGGRTIRKMTTDGVVSTFGGTGGAGGSADGIGSAARFNFPAGIAVDTAGNVYVSDYADNTIRVITPGSVVTTLAGQAGASGFVNGTGAV